MIEVRAAHRDDADAIAQAHVAGWRVGYRGLFPDEYLDAAAFEHERVERWRAWTWGDGNDSAMFVGVVDGRVMGFAHAGAERVDAAESRQGEVYGFYVHPDAWGSGVAAALMASALDHLMAAGFDDAVLWVLRDNPRARSFYAKAGWAPTGVEQMWTGPTVLGIVPTPVAEVQYGVKFAQGDLPPVR